MKEYRKEREKQGYLNTLVSVIHYTPRLRSLMWALQMLCRWATPPALYTPSPLFEPELGCSAGVLSVLTSEPARDSRGKRWKWKEKKKQRGKLLVPFSATRILMCDPLVTKVFTFQVGASCIVFYDYSSVGEKDGVYLFHCTWNLKLLYKC